MRVREASSPQVTSRAQGGPSPIAVNDRAPATTVAAASSRTGVDG
ncbi:hypothetical protein [Saccharothrix syringae]|nr:hypothetical protein [Saccharothrix syringae]